jgi:hypothetical protein
MSKTANAVVLMAGRSPLANTILTLSSIPLSLLTIPNAMNGALERSV